MKTETLSPLLAEGQFVDWWFAFKFNAATYPGDESKEPNPGIFVGTPKDYKGEFCLNYAIASSVAPTLQMGPGYIGGSLDDPLGATFNQITTATATTCCGTTSSTTTRLQARARTGATPRAALPGTTTATASYCK